MSKHTDTKGYQNKNKAHQDEKKKHTRKNIYKTENNKMIITHPFLSISILHTHGLNFPVKRHGMA